ncbi:hypothetical protein [Cetobacterium sp.]|uniref:hypothetical protein n=1 Tax=Cetobacterium sp. TaxID=2071632 RepID=UPI003F2AAE2C
MKYYLHRVVAKKSIDGKNLKILEYTIQEFDTYKRALEVYMRDFLIEGDTEHSYFNSNIQITMKKIKAKVYKSLLRTYEVLTLNLPQVSIDVVENI